MLQLTFASTEAPGMIEDAVADGEKTTSKIAQFTADKDELCGNIDNYLVDVSGMVKNLTGLTNQIKELERYSTYLQMIGRIEDLRYTVLLFIQVDVLCSLEITEFVLVLVCL